MKSKCGKGVKEMFPHRTLYKLSLISIILIAFVGIADAETIALRSGNGEIGNSDNLICFLQKGTGDGQGGSFENPFTADDFSSAKNGPSAFITAPHNPESIQWISNLQSDTQAKWITSSAGGNQGAAPTALFAIDFNVQTQNITSAKITLAYAVDNLLGDSTHEGLYLNGEAIIGSKSPGEGDPDNAPSLFNSQQGPITFDVLSLIETGNNTLFLNMVNSSNMNPGNPAGLIFSATVEVIPEPTTLSLLAIGGLAMIRRKK